MSERGHVARAAVPAPTGPVDDTADLGLTPDPWDEYRTALRELDRVRRAAAESATAARAAAAELSTVRSRLAGQRSRLGDSAPAAPGGVLGAARRLGGASRMRADAADPRPSDAEIAAASAALRSAPAPSLPAAALDALRRAQATLDAADTALAAARPAPPTAPPPAAAPPPAQWPPALRNLLVYGPLAVLSLLLQIPLLASASRDAPVLWLAAVGALALPAAGYGAGWVAIGLIPWGGDQPADRTPVLGALVCLIPAAVGCVGLGLVALLR